MSLEIITSIEQLRLLEPEWDALWRRSAAATPFQSPHWLMPWWETFGNGELYAIAASDGRELQCLAPFYILRDDDSDESLGLLLGTGLSDYLDVLADAGHAEAIFEQLAKADCQMWDLHQLPSSSSLLTAASPPGWNDHVEDHEPCPGLDIERGVEAVLSSHARKRVRYAERSLSGLGELVWEPATSSSLDGMLETLFVLHGARWRRRNLPGVLADAAVRHFHRHVARRMLEAGALQMFALRIGDDVAGVYYGFAGRTTAYYYLSGFDPDLERFSIGRVMVAHAIEEAHGAGAVIFDFLRGAEDYKYAWGASDRRTRRRILTRITQPGS
jgi:CelD/BcsL family acetyltransferase involved in cellulose biosynthesis